MLELHRGSPGDRRKRRGKGRSKKNEKSQATVGGDGLCRYPSRLVPVACELDAGLSGWVSRRSVINWTCEEIVKQVLFVRIQEKKI